jgi:hypothetical protein
MKIETLQTSSEEVGKAFTRVECPELQGNPDWQLAISALSAARSAEPLRFGFGNRTEASASATPTMLLAVLAFFYAKEIYDIDEIVLRFHADSKLRRLFPDMEITQFRLREIRRGFRPELEECLARLIAGPISAGTLCTRESAHPRVSRTPIRDACRQEAAQRTRLAILMDMAAQDF